MKPHLPKKLFVALCAAITAMGFTLPQSFATVSWNGGTSDHGGTIGDDLWFYTNNGKTGSTLLDDEHGQVNITAEGEKPVTAGIAEVSVKDGTTVRISGGNYWGEDRTFAALTIEDITAGDGTGSILLSTQPYATDKSPANTTAMVKAVTGTLSGVQNYGVLTLGVDSTSSFNLAGAIVNNVGTVTLNGIYTFDTTDATQYELREKGYATWTDEANQQGFKKYIDSSYYAIKSATAGVGFKAVSTTGALVQEEEIGTYYFTSNVTDYTRFYVNTSSEKFSNAWAAADAHGAMVASVTLAQGASIIADKEGASFALSLTGASGSLCATEATTIKSITGLDNYTLTITGVEGNTDVVTITALSGTGNLIVGENANVSLNSLTSYTGTLSVTGGITTVSGNSNVIEHVIDLQDGVLSLAGVYDISSLSPSSGPCYIGGEGIGEGNGFFKEASGTVQVVKISNGGKLLQAEGVNFTYGTQSSSLNEQGQFVLSTGAVDYTTLYVNNANAVSYDAAWKLAQSQHATISTVMLANNTTITTDREGADIDIFIVGESGVVKAVKATTISSISGWSSNTLTIAGEAAVTLLPSQIIGLDAKMALVIDTEVSSQKIRLNGTDAHLEVKVDGLLTTSNNLTLTSGTVDVCGTVNVGKDVDLSDGGKSIGTLRIHGGGKVTVKDSMWMASSAVGVLLDEDAIFAIAGKGVCFTGKNSGGSIITTAENTSYTTYNADFSITNAAITATADITIGNKLIEGDVVIGSHTVTLTNAASTYRDIAVSEGGRLIANFDLNISGTMKLAEGSSIQASAINIGEKVSMRSKDSNSLQIGADTDISEIELHGVDGKGKLKNMSMTTFANYTIKDMTISHSLIEVGENTTMYLVNVDISSDTRITDDAAWLDMVATHGWLDDTNTEAAAPVMSLGDALFYRSGDDAWVRLGHDVSYVALTSELFSNVTLTGSDLWLDLTGLAGTIGNAQAFSIAFKDGARYDVNGLRVVATVDGEHYLDGYYTTKQEGSTTTLYFSKQIPEPATSTLSLLALAALAARRRRTR
ncbi:MAG: hypothetical protein Q4E43_07450 [Akkermansia sp.]|nr:hypothetical protein [Akkermansia sp.]